MFSWAKPLSFLRNHNHYYCCNLRVMIDLLNNEFSMLFLIKFIIFSNIIMINGDAFLHTVGHILIVPSV